ncbi:uncharacterized protein LOC126666889 [Mercurialis annua]|uniref:uncharacterized protein LOC126666889 n=1 Tax=Mercurialis annua TaxID=3986 RepID=UPI00215DE8C5|nr:uncharacterized protein LOC126666889 [Mercurialis annua]
MGSFIGHVFPGLAFVFLGLWHLFNHIKLHSLPPNSYTSSAWFPTAKVRYIELYMIILCSSISVSMELFIGPSKHQPLDTDGTIPSNHLRNFEHSSISMFFLVYATFAIFLDKLKANVSVKFGLTQLIAALAFAQELFLFHLHSTDHHGLEGQYHLLLQFIVIVSLATTLFGIGMPKSFLVSFVRSVSILFQGVWFIVMGYMLWTPKLIPKGCLIHNEDGHIVVRCGSQDALNRAKSLVNIEFSWLLIGITIFSISFYIGLVEMYSKKVVYSSFAKELEDLRSDAESQSDTEKTFTALYMER